MWLSRHVFIDRVSKKNTTKTGARNLYLQSNESVQQGVPMFFFPQGTRRLAKRLDFKDGAFKIATENNCTLIPISIDIPTSVWNSFYPWTTNKPIVLTVHKGIESKGKDIIELKQCCFDTIYSVLPDYSKDK